jgi:hypothetical protein
MITIRPGSHAAMLVASIMAERQASTMSLCIKPRKCLTADLPVRVHRPIMIRHAMRAK